jgi:hypothetical protein
VEPFIDLAPGADQNALAAKLGELIRHNVAVKAHKARDFRTLRGAVMIVPRDTGEALTLRFDLGRLTVHDGSIGIPTVTFLGDEASILRLADVPFTRIFKLPVAFEGRGRAILRAALSEIASGELKIYGLYAHPRMVLRFLRIVSVHG